MNGGKRPGAGRKPGKANSKRAELMKLAGEDLSGKVLAEVDVVAAWKRLLDCASPKVVFATLSYLHDRVYGRPVQMLAGDVNRPISIHLEWKAPTPQWAEPINVTPASNLLAIPIEAIVSDSSENRND